MKKRAVVSVIGKDQVGIIANITTVLAENNINILDISQTILQEFFTMIMVIEVSDTTYLEPLQKKLVPVEKAMSLQINIQLEDIFQAMHRV